MSFVFGPAALRSAMTGACRQQGSLSGMQLQPAQADYEESMGLRVDIRSITIYPRHRPGPADDMTHAEDRDQAARELKTWLEWPYEIEINIEVGDPLLGALDLGQFAVGISEEEIAEIGKLNLYGTVARTWLREWMTAAEV